jgi:hypothetical protein
MWLTTSAKKGLRSPTKPASIHHRRMRAAVTRQKADRERKGLGIVVTVAHLADEFAADVIGDGVALGFVLGGVDHGAHAKILDPFWKRLR